MNPEPTDQPLLDVSKAPLPTPKTLAQRQSLPFQFLRFLAFNVRIMRMVIRGHH
ncbi:MAG: hypothetical protein WAS07_04055 [Micropruina sp.]|nr:hypothetical protein [Micropruina sp.]